jgi:hypothetical protein
MFLLFEGLIFLILPISRYVSERKTSQKKMIPPLKTSNHFSTGDSASYKVLDMPQHGYINHCIYGGPNTSAPTGKDSVESLCALWGKTVRPPPFQEYHVQLFDVCPMVCRFIRVHFQATFPELDAASSWCSKKLLEHLTWHSACKFLMLQCYLIFRSSVCINK